MKKALPLLFILGVSLSILILSGCQMKDDPNATAQKNAELITEDAGTEEIMYLASERPMTRYYSLNEEGSIVLSGVEYRGEKVIIQGNPITHDGFDYVPLKGENTNIYYRTTDLVSEYCDCVKETTKYVRTSATTYADPDDSSIVGLVRKGSAINITGFDKLIDGEPTMIKATDDNGNEYWVFNKYLVDTQEAANAVYTEYHELNKDKVFDLELYGGSPTTLDYYPYVSDLVTNNEMPSECRTYYLNVATIDNIDTYIDVCKTASANAVVVDIKDYSLAYHAHVAEEYSPTSYAGAYHDNEAYRSAIEKLNQAGLWTIGRIVVFNDPLFAEDNPDECILNNGENLGWPSAYSRRAWEYNVKLAVSAVEEMGFNEIQFDYVRFPENAYSLSKAGTADFRNSYAEEKAEAIQNFCIYAADQIHRAGAYFSVDVFGECSNGYVTSYGQYWPAISNIVDAISSMPYIDHFGRDVDTWSDGYTTVYNWATGAAAAQSITPNPAVPRTWLTCYAVPFWDSKIEVSADFFGNQIQALWDAGVGYGGFIPWNAASNANVYYTIAPSYQREYQ